MFVKFYIYYILQCANISFEKWLHYRKLHYNSKGRILKMAAFIVGGGVLHGIFRWGIMSSGSFLGIFCRVYFVDGIFSVETLSFSLFSTLNWKSCINYRWKTIYYHCNERFFNYKRESYEWTCFKKCAEMDEFIGLRTLLIHRKARKVGIP